MTVTTPPRPPRLDDLRDRSALEALREQALIEEARRRTDDAVRQAMAR